MELNILWYQGRNKIYHIIQTQLSVHQLTSLYMIMCKLAVHESEKHLLFTSVISYFCQIHLLNYTVFIHLLSLHNLQEIVFFFNLLIKPYYSSGILKSQKNLRI